MRKDLADDENFWEKVKEIHTNILNIVHVLNIFKVCLGINLFSNCSSDKSKLNLLWEVVRLGSEEGSTVFMTSRKDSEK